MPTFVACSTPVYWRRAIALHRSRHREVASAGGAHRTHTKGIRYVESELAWLARVSWRGAGAAAAVVATRLAAASAGGAAVWPTAGRILWPAAHLPLHPRA